MAQQHEIDENTRLARVLGNTLIDVGGSDIYLNDTMDHALDSACGGMQMLHAYLDSDDGEPILRDASWGIMSSLDVARSMWKEMEYRRNKRREAAPGSDHQPRSVKPLTSAAATVRDAVETLEDIGLRLREQDNPEASAVMTLVAALRDADSQLEAHFS